jgi:hypothetical protein
MRIVVFVAGLLVIAAVVEPEAQRRGSATATLAVVVSDPGGAPVPGVLVSLQGPAERNARTEGGRIAFENLPAGAYRLRFEREGFITLERELSARAGAPVNVKVTLNPAPAPPPPPPAPVPTPAPERPKVNARPVIMDLPDTIEKTYVGRAPERLSELACGGLGSATLIQLNKPLAQQAHDASDAFLYVIAGEGIARVAGREERLRAGVLLFVPQTVPYALAQTGRNPLIVLETKAGEGCSSAKTETREPRP